MRALTIRQPYASLIARQTKRWETRSWKTSYRGPLLIHAGQRWDMEHDEAEHEWHGWSNDLCGLCLLGDALGHDQTPSEIPLGAVVAVAQLTDCVRIVEDQGPHFTPFNGPQDPDVILVAPDLAVGPRARYWHGAQSTDITDQLPYGYWEPGGWAWKLDDIRPLAEPIPAKGRQRLWRPDPDLAAAVTEGNQP